MNRRVVLALFAVILLALPSRGAKLGFLEIEIRVSGPPNARPFVQRFLEQRLNQPRREEIKWLPAADADHLRLEMPMTLDEQGVISRIVQPPRVTVNQVVVTGLIHVGGMIIKDPHRDIRHNKTRIATAKDFLSLDPAANTYLVPLSEAATHRLPAVSEQNLQIDMDEGVAGSIQFIAVTHAGGKLRLELSADQAAWVRYAMAPATLEVVRIERGHL